MNTDERRYNDDEVRDIFGLAARGAATGAPSVREQDGMTLASIQEIGREAGLEPMAIAQAAARLEARALRPPQRTSLGMPIEVTRVVELPRPLSEIEWETLVAELRATFGAKGKISAHGGLREWTNGNLHAYVEPDESGYRLRIRTLKGNAAALNVMGAVSMAAGWVGVGTILLSNGPHGALFPPAMLAAAGTGVILTNFARLSQWAKQRAQQMDYMGAKMRSIIAVPPRDAHDARDEHDPHGG